MKVWVIPPGEAYVVEGKRRRPIELSAPLEIREDRVEVVRGLERRRFLSFRAEGRVLEVAASRCSLLTLEGEDHVVVQDVEYGSW